MDVTKIPFAQTVGLSKADDGALMLEMSEAVSNHLGTMHASAQFTLAETASGKLLAESFRELEGKVVPVLRNSQIKFKRPAESRVKAYAVVSEESSKSLLEQLDRRGRGSIEVAVEVKDSEGKTTCSGVFVWFVQSIAE